MGKLWGMVLAVALSLGLGCGARPHTPAEKAQAATWPVAVVSVFGGGKATAWYVDDHLAVTAGHVCMFGNDANYTVGDARAWPIAVDYDTDVCVLATESEAPAVLRLATRAPELGDDLVYVGYPQGARVMGHGTAAECKSQDDETVQSLCALIPGTWGSSGSAVLNDRGDVVGLVSQFYGYPGSPVIELATAEEIRAVLADALGSDSE